MAKEDKPLEYQRRIRDTKGVAQRIDLGYLKRPSKLLLSRRRLTWIAVAAAAMGGIPLVIGVADSRQAISKGQLSEAHTIFEKRCEVCHTQAFGAVRDISCQQCHDGAAHPAKAMDTARAHTTPPCGECHVEHRGKVRLAAVFDVHCVRCHANLTEHAAGVKLKAVAITAFQEGKHPEFSTVSARDERPLRLNHAAHMPAEPKTIRGIKLPMKCADCHATDRNSSTGALLPVTFELHCKACHARELEFDVDRLLGPKAPPAPHSRDPRAIREFIVTAYQAALVANPMLVHRPIGNDLFAQPSRAAWLERAIEDSESYLFGRKCSYCHLVSPAGVVTKVNVVSGRYVESKPEGEPWLPRAEFAHRSHRAVECESCHTAARTSAKTEDVLAPGMKTCLPCHGDSGAGPDRCSLCHLYHNRSLESDRERRPTKELVGKTAL